MKYIILCVAFFLFVGVPVFAETSEVNDNLPAYAELFQGAKWEPEDEVVWVKTINKGTADEIRAYVEIAVYINAFEGAAEGNHTITYLAVEPVLLFEIVAGCENSTEARSVLWVRGDTSGSYKECGLPTKMVKIPVKSHEGLGELPEKVVSFFDE